MALDLMKLFDMPSDPQESEPESEHLLDPTVEGIDIPLPESLPDTGEILEFAETVSMTPRKNKLPALHIPDHLKQNNSSPTDERAPSLNDEELSVLSDLQANRASLDKLSERVTTMESEVRNVPHILTKIDLLLQEIKGLETTVSTYDKRILSIQQAFTAYQTKTAEDIAAVERRQANKQLSVAASPNTSLIPATVSHTAPVVPAMASTNLPAPPLTSITKTVVNLSDWDL